MQQRRFILKNRKLETHKGDYGRVLVVAGSPGMLGAGALASRAALRSGAGLVYWAVAKELVNYANTLTPEVIVIPLEKIKQTKVDVVAFGPGLTVSRQTKRLLHEFIAGDKPLVIDAYGLNTLAAHRKLAEKIRQQHIVKTVLTPHPGEMARLLKKETREIQKSRLKSAIMAAVLFHSIVVLKGHQSVIANPSGYKHLNLTGNPGMATAGSGDVLTGVIAGLIAQGLSLWAAAKIGTQLHGLAGDLAAKEKGEVGLIASDLVEKLPYAIQNTF
jgi:NAD(P)H-hydrate epimerase